MEEFINYLIGLNDKKGAVAIGFAAAIAVEFVLEYGVRLVKWQMSPFVPTPGSLCERIMSFLALANSYGSISRSDSLVVDGGDQYLHVKGGGKRLDVYFNQSSHGEMDMFHIDMVDASDFLSDRERRAVSKEARKARQAVMARDKANDVRDRKTKLGIQ